MNATTSNYCVRPFAPPALTLECSLRSCWCLRAGASLNAHNECKASAATLGPTDFEVLAYLLKQGFNYNLNHVAYGVSIVDVPDDSEAQQWKLKVNELLKARGAKIPKRQN